MRNYINTEYFSEVANYYKKNNVYTNARPKTKEFLEFWRREKDRCLNGYEVGGMRITGLHYTYLNYCPIKQLDISNKIAQRNVNFPKFWDGDYEYFHSLDIARNGITQEDFDSLGLEINPLNLSGNRHIVVLKARRKGFSYKGGIILAHNLILQRNSNCIAAAFDWKYLIGDALLDKMQLAIDHFSKTTPFAQPFLIDKKTHKITGYKEKTSTGFVNKGTRNEFEARCIALNPDNLRGVAPNYLLFEEAGKFPTLKKAWNIAQPSMEQGIYTLGTMIAFGTGGSEGSDYASLEELFYNPDAYKILPFQNIWDDIDDERKCGFFFPANKNLDGFIDENGNSNMKDAKEWILNNREALKGTTNDPITLAQNKSEFCLTPREATLQSSGTVFDSNAILEQINHVNKNSLQHALVPGKFFRNNLGKVEFKPDLTKKIIFEYPIKDAETIEGTPYILEDRKTGLNHLGQIEVLPIYSSGVDPYAVDKGDNKARVKLSVGCTWILKGDSIESPTFNNCIIAGYIGRPKSMDEYNDQLFMMCEYYNCQVFYENNRGNISEYAKRQKMETMLKRSIDHNFDDKSIRKSNVPKYGMTMTEGKKLDGIGYIAEWLNEIVYYDEENEVRKTPLHFIYDLGLLNELLKYDGIGNFDRISALIVLIYNKVAKLQVKRKVVRNNYNDSFFNRVR